MKVNSTCLNQTPTIGTECIM